jgi:hypothetical protein
MTVTKIIHALLVDPIAQKVDVVTINPTDELSSAYRHICCDLIEAGYRDPNGDVIYVDEEGLMNDKAKGFFSYRGNSFKGRGLIVNECGDCWTAPKSPIVQLLRDITFPKAMEEPPFDRADILAAMVTGQFHVMTKRDYEPFLDAQPGSVICYDLKGWTVIVSPGEASEEAISVHAYYFPDPERQGPQEESNWMLTTDGWSNL